jgi:TorA maturation chaperone TorD
MSGTVAPLKLGAYVSPEDHGRANFYALISRLFADAPDQALLQAIAGSPPLASDDSGEPLSLAWSKMIAASSVMDADAARDEYDSLFVGAGKAPVNLHASHHLTGFMMETPLAELRSTLATIGFARLESQTVVEDHLAALCEVMRLLIVGADGIEPATLSTQKQFFEAHIAPWFELCCSAILKSSLANFYGVVAQFASSFLLVEREGFAIDV